jgi:hypothetical protein
MEGVANSIACNISKYLLTTEPSNSGESAEVQIKIHLWLLKDGYDQVYPWRWKLIQLNSVNVELYTSQDQTELSVHIRP